MKRVMSVGILVDWVTWQREKVKHADTALDCPWVDGAIASSQQNSSWPKTNPERYHTIEVPVFIKANLYYSGAIVVGGFDSRNFTRLPSYFGS